MKKLYLAIASIVVHTTVSHGDTFDERMADKVVGQELFRLNGVKGNNLIPVISALKIDPLILGKVLTPNDVGTFDLRPLQREECKIMSGKLAWHMRHRGKIGFLVGFVCGCLLFI